MRGKCYVGYSNQITVNTMLPCLFAATTTSTLDTSQYTREREISGYAVLLLSLARFWITW